MKVPPDNSSEFCCAKPTSFCWEEAQVCADLRGMLNPNKMALLWRAAKHKF